MTDLVFSSLLTDTVKIVKEDTHIESKQTSAAQTEVIPKGGVDAFRFLQSLQEFSKLPVGEVKVLAEASRFAILDAGQYITTEGEDESAYGFIVAEGIIAMQKSSVSGKELIVELLQPGDIFGMLLMLGNESLPSQLSARALQKSKVLWVPINNFAHLLKAQPILFKEFAAHLLLCLQSSYGLSKGLAHDRVEVRIAAIFASLALKFEKTADFNGVCTLNFTRQQLADLTGSTSETAIRVTGAMQRAGLIDIKKPGVIGILNLKGLLEIAES